MDGYEENILRVIRDVGIGYTESSANDYYAGYHSSRNGILRSHLPRAKPPLWMTVQSDLNTKSNSLNLIVLA